MRGCACYGQRCCHCRRHPLSVFLLKALAEREAYNWSSGRRAVAWEWRQDSCEPGARASWNRKERVSPRAPGQWASGQAGAGNCVNSVNLVSGPRKGHAAFGTFRGLGGPRQCK